MNFYNYQSAPVDMKQEIVDGLSRSPRVISPKYFYDKKGSEIFESICKTPEYYITRTEISILEKNLTDIANVLGVGCLLIEPGSGNSLKVCILMDALKPSGYIPIDISRDYLIDAAQDITMKYPWLEVYAVCTDFTSSIRLPSGLPKKNRIAFFPGSSIGNFSPKDAGRFLTNVAKIVGSKGGLLIGVDLIKESEILNAAYNDSKGFTAAFNLNLLTHINRALHADFNVNAFYHEAIFNDSKGCMQMFLGSKLDQSVKIGPHTFQFEKGDRIHTENSYKYSIGDFQKLAATAGFRPVKSWVDPEQLFSIHYLCVE